MGVISTGAIFKTLTFDGRSSSEFNVYITGEGVFNAPERAVEMISIPGRNGAFALDYGRFENIEVTYNCGIAGDDDADFASAISDFRNWLCSRNGYVRLSDDYNAGEYRMAVYKSGLEVTAENLKAGEFPVVFECKPQRFLTSGEDTISVTSGDTITNPTLFDSKPLLKIKGYGEININSDIIHINNLLIGDVVIYTGEDFTVGSDSPQSTTFTIDTSMFNAGDTLTIGSVKCITSFKQPSLSPSPTGGIQVLSSTNMTTISDPNKGLKQITTDQTSFTLGTSGTFTSTASCRMTISGTNYNFTITASVAYDGTDGFTITISDNASLPSGYDIRYGNCISCDISGDSTKSALGNPMYLDLDIGEAWNEDYGTIVSVNNAVNLPAELPTFPPGLTTIIYDGTITSLEVVPRWFKI